LEINASPLTLSASSVVLQEEKRAQMPKYSRLIVKPQQQQPAPMASTNMPMPTPPQGMMMGGGPMGGGPMQQQPRMSGKY